MKKMVTLLLIIISVSCKEETIKPPSLDNDIERLCKSTLTFAHTPGVAVGIIKNGTKKFYSYGIQSLSSSKPIDEFTIVEIGSITKTFNALLFADMAINKIVSLSDSANQYLPSMLHVPSKDGISVRLTNMLNHTSGLPREPEKLDQSQPFAFSEDQMSEYLKTVSLLSRPGIEYLYSNTAVGLSGYMIKQITRVPFNQRVKEKIFAPLGMNYTFCDNAEIPSENVAQGYFGDMPVDFYEWSNVFESAGDIKSNMHDMLIYLDNAMNTEQSIYKDAFELAEKPTFQVNDKLKVGLGWHLLKLDDDEIIWHNGGTHGFHTFIAFNKVLKYGIVVISNSYSVEDSDILAIDILRTLRKYH